MSIYIVQSGDTLSTISEHFAASVSELAYVNQLPFPYALTPGQALFIPTANLPESVPGLPPPNGITLPRNATIGGYAYPFISPYVLSEALPYLTDLYVFSYGFTAEGTLLPPALNPDFMISMAHDAGVRPILTLTPFDALGRFSNYLITALINSSTRVDTLIGQLIEEIQSRGYQGVDIDFEYILADDRDAFVSFVSKVQAAVSALGFETSVALAPKSSADQKGLLYEGKDYPALGAVADYVLLMTYEWGYKYGPPLAVAPINQVRRVVEYALSEIPAGKIHLGIPNYGYDWPLPYVRDQTVATTIGNVEAVQLAIANGAPIQFDVTAGAPFFIYSDFSGISHEVWFEDVRDFEEKYRLIIEYGLRGMSYWTVMQLFRAGWYEQNIYFTPSKM